MVSPADVVTWPYRAVRGAVVAFRLWRQLQADADARICLGFKRQQEILSDQVREAEARGDTGEEERATQLLHRVQDNELAYHQSRMADLAAHVLADRAPAGVIGPDLPKLPEPDRAGLQAAVSALQALVSAQTAQDHFLRGNALHTAQDFEGALKEYNAALTLHPDGATTLYNRGVTLHQLQRYEEALADYTRSLELRAEDSATLNNRGLALADLGRHEAALADYKRSLELHPDYPKTLNNRGISLSKLRRHDEALADFNRCLELQPDDPDTLYNRGTILDDLKRYDEALADYYRSLELCPGNPRALNARGITLTHLQRYEEALADFNRSLALRPDDADTIGNIACLYSLWGRYDESLQWLEKAIACGETQRTKAAEDADFASLRADPEFGPRFRKLIEEKSP